MFFNQVKRNASKIWKDNGLFFGSLIVAIVSFYTLLSMGNQDVMLFLKTVESDAVRKLMLLILTIYMVSLFFVFFLVYFAYRFQLENRKKELGLYLMLGMRRSKLFIMLMNETIINSLISVVIGLPIALLLTEGVSLATAKVIGLGIMEHKITFSLSALLGTVIGFIAVQVIAMLIISVRFSRIEPIELLHSDAPEKQDILEKKNGQFSFFMGTILLVLAYAAGITMLKGFDFIIVTLILVLGGSGTFYLYHGMSSFIGRKIKRMVPLRANLYAFTGRQVQESVLKQHKSLAISSLLLLMAITCLSFGVGIASGRGSMETRTVDFSVEGSEQELTRILTAQDNGVMVEKYYPMFLSNMKTNRYDQNGKLVESDVNGHDFSWEGLIQSLEKLPMTTLKNNIIDNFSGASYPYLISASSYNEILKTVGKPQIDLKENEVALYTSMKDNSELMSSLKKALNRGGYIVVDGAKYNLMPEIYYDNVVADRKITLYSALIVSDTNYKNWIDDAGEPFCWNLQLDQKFVDEKGLMQAIQHMGQIFSNENLTYESYLEGIGRNLFYTVATSYIAIYLGILFMIIANTVIGLKYLIGQRMNKRRYISLLMLGTDAKALCQSARHQIRVYFALAISVAVISGIFAVWSMFTSFLKLPAGTSLTKVLLISGISFVLFTVVEWIYIVVIEHASNREIMAIRVTDRG